VSRDGGEAKTLPERGSNPQYSDGFLLTVVDGNLVARPFDVPKAVLAGEARPIAANVEHYEPRDLGQFSVSGAGVVVYRQARLRRTQPVWLDRGGRELVRVGESSFYYGAHMGADARTLALSRSDSDGTNVDVWTLDLRRSQMTRSTFVSARGDSINGAVSADGAQLAVSVTALAGWGGPSLWIQPTAGSGSQKPIVEKGLFRVAQWSADGAHLIGETQDAETGWDIAYLTLADAAKPVRLTSSQRCPPTGVGRPSARMRPCGERFLSATSRKEPAGGRCRARAAGGLLGGAMAESCTSPVPRVRWRLA
jgi:hypothetical protein